MWRQIDPHLDLVKGELEHRVFMFSEKDKPHYFKGLDNYYKWFNYRNHEANRRNINIRTLGLLVGKKLEKIDENVLEERYGVDHDLGVLLNFIKSVPVNNFGLVNFFLNKQEPLHSRVLRYERSFLETNVAVFRENLFETLFLLRNLKSFMNNSGDDTWLRAFQSNPKNVYDKYLDGLMNVIFTNAIEEERGEGLYIKLSQGISTSSPFLKEKMVEDNDEVKVFSPVDDYLVAVLMDISSRMRDKMVIKETKPRILKREFASWIYPHAGKRIHRDFQLAKYLCDILPDNFVIFPKAVYEDTSASQIIIEKIEGKSLKELKRTDLVQYFIRLLPFVQKKAYFERDSLEKGLVEKLELQKEFDVILDNLGYKEKKLRKLYKPIVSLMKSLDFETFCHGSLHPRNVLFNGEKFGVIDWENTMISYQDDVIRLIEGPLIFNPELKENILQEYFLISSEINEDFFEEDWVYRIGDIINVGEIPEEKLDNYHKFLLSYNLRRFALHTYAADYMLSNGDEEKAAFQLRSAEEALVMASYYKELLPELKTCSKEDIDILCGNYREELGKVQRLRSIL